MTLVKMSPRQELMARLSRLEAEIVEFDGLLKSECGTKVCARLTSSSLLETLNAIEALLLVKS